MDRSGEAHWREFEDLLNSCSQADQARLREQAQRLGRLASTRDAADRHAQGLVNQARTASLRRQRRAEAIPQVTYPPALPITSHKDRIVELIRAHPVVVIAGETGSGKTTQIPKMCVEAGLGVDGRIGCTQPRRVAALSISRRVAEELAVPWGRQVGCKIRFSDESSQETCIKFMTDGILLAETQGDPDLREYEAIVIDEAHERSLNIDFLLGHLKLLLQRRPDLKLVITSATINTQAFSEAFGGAPIVEVSGRMFPVEIRYAPIDAACEESGELTYIDAAVRETENILLDSERGDILIFMPSERDIRETRDLLQGRFGRDAEVVPLFGRLSNADQQRVFAPSSRRKIVVATNIAETSLTIPGIRYVIDTGLVRISRYNPRTRVKRLPIEPVPQSSAQQRSGRSGRVEEGICIRLYSEEDFLGQPAFGQPEIQRANLAEVILRMKAFHLGDIETFPFLNPPTPQAIASGYQLLHELGALDEDRRLTRLGRDLARLPIDPTMGRMILEAQQEHCLEEVLVIAAGLSIQDPRERPMDAREAADQAQKRFQHARSDFQTLLNIWNAFHDQLEAMKTQNQARRFCKAHFLSYTRMREWTDLYGQLRDSLEDITAWPPKQGRRSDAPGDNPRPERRERRPEMNEAGLYRAIHRAILSGLLGQIAQRAERNVYKAAGNRELMLFPGSGLFDRSPPKKAKQAGREPSGPAPVKSSQPEWVVAGEIVETSRLYARTVAAVESDWIVELGKHLCKTQYDSPHWSRSSGRVLARERLFLHGFEICQRRVDYGLINPREATDIFIRSALVEDEIDSPHRFLEHNRKLREKIETWQTRLRHYEFSNLDRAFYDFYASRIENASSVHALNRLLRERLASDPDFLCAREEELTGGKELNFDAEAFPDEVRIGTSALPITYSYAPGEEHDGVTLQVPLGVAQSVESAHLQWVIPAFREEQMEHLLRSLPKSLRVPLMPLAPKAAEMARALPTLPGLEALSRWVRQKYEVNVPASAWDLEALPAHLRVRFEVTGRDQKILATGRDLDALRARLQESETRAAQHAEESTWTRAAAQWERYGLAGWSFGDPPEQIEVTQVQGLPVWAYPGLQVEQADVCLRLFRKREEAEHATRAGFERLCELALAKKLAWLQKDLKSLDRLKDLYVTLGPGEELKETAYLNLKRFLFQPPSLLPLKEAIFTRTIAEADANIGPLVSKMADLIGALLNARQQILLCRKPYPGMRADLDLLVPARFLEKIPFNRLQHLPRYLKAMLVRAERAALNPPKDQERVRQIAPYLAHLARIEKTASPAQRERTGAFRWMIEEFKVSLFAQELGTAEPVSAKRLDKAIEELQSRKDAR